MLKFTLSGRAARSAAMAICSSVNCFSLASRASRAASRRFFIYCITQCHGKGHGRVRELAVVAYIRTTHDRASLRREAPEDYSIYVNACAS
jgi:hypothetical protein